MFQLTVRPGLTLGFLEKRHAPQLWELIDRNRARLDPWLPWVPGTQSVADVEHFLDRAAGQHATGDGFHAGILVEGQLAGMVGLHPIDWANRRVEIGYWLDAASEGRRLMLESVTYLVTHCFREYGLTRVEIRCADFNSRSAAVAERLGFHHEGTLRQAEYVNGRYLDLRIYGMLRDDWLHSR